MLEIVLVRHGRPLLDDRSRIDGHNFGEWVMAFDRAPLDAMLPPPPSLIARAATARCVVTSTLRRSVESAALLAPGRPVLSEALFVEAGLPTVIPGSFALSPKYWDAVARIAWFCGWSAGGESRAAARQRAQRGAARLSDLARKHGSVLLVGHGMLNAYIQSALRASGWSGAGRRWAYWSHVVLRRAA